MLSGPQSYMEVIVLLIDGHSNAIWVFIQMQFAMQNSAADWRRILLGDSTPPKADLFHSTIHNLLSKLLS